jgi:GT2 family glycosyltransferase
MFFTAVPPQMDKMTQTDEQSLTVSVIIPVHNGGENFSRCLEALSRTEPPADEVIIVADGESDGSWRMAEKFHYRILKRDTPAGPAAARNMGAQEAQGAILFFIDADVAVQPATIGKIKEFFVHHPDIHAVMGSYDDSPSEPNFLSQYKNLFHHYVHQTSNPEASTFWTACGAIRKEVFDALKGFDESRCRPLAGARPGTIEDVELGYRMKEAGYSIHLAKDIQVKHLKRWETVSFLKTEFFHRALPWTELLLRKERLVNDLNLKKSSRLSIILIFALLLCFPAFLLNKAAIPAALSCMVFLLALNWDCYRFFYKKRGAGFTLLVIPWHWFYFFYSGIAFIIGNIVYRKRTVSSG